MKRISPAGPAAALSFLPRPSSGLFFWPTLCCVALATLPPPPSRRPSPFIQFSVSHSVSLLAAGRRGAACSRGWPHVGPSLAPSCFLAFIALLRPPLFYRSRPSPLSSARDMGLSRAAFVVPSPLTALKTQKGRSGVYHRGFFLRGPRLRPRHARAVPLRVSYSRRKPHC